MLWWSFSATMLLLISWAFGCVTSRRIWLLHDTKSWTHSDLWQSLRLYDIVSTLGKFGRCFLASKGVPCFSLHQALTLHVRVKISKISATKWTTSGVQAHFHKLSCGLLVLSIARRWDEIGSEKIVDVAFGTILCKWALGLLHQLLHDLREVAILLFIHWFGLITCNPTVLEKVYICYQVSIAASLELSCLISDPCTAHSSLNHVIRAGRLILAWTLQARVIIIVDSHCRRSQSPIFILQWWPNMNGLFWRRYLR